jgi:hypothetical protein
MHRVIVVRQTVVHTAGPLVPQPSASEHELDIGKLKCLKPPGIDEIPEKLFKARVERFAVRLFLFGIRRNYLRSGRCQS